MRRISVKGIVIGGIVDVVAAMLGNLIAVIFLVNRLVAAGATGAAGPIIAPPSATPAVLLVVAGLCSLFGGYVAARIANHDELLNGALSSYLAIAIGLALLPLDLSHTALRSLLISIVTAVVLGMLGGYVRAAQLHFWPAEAAE